MAFGNAGIGQFGQDSSYITPAFGGGIGSSLLAYGLQSSGAGDYLDKNLPNGWTRNGSQLKYSGPSQQGIAPNPTDQRLAQHSQTSPYSSTNSTPSGTNVDPRALETLGLSSPPSAQAPLQQDTSSSPPQSVPAPSTPGIGSAGDSLKGMLPMGSSIPTPGSGGGSPGGMVSGMTRGIGGNAGGVAPTGAAGGGVAGGEVASGGAAASSMGGAGAEAAGAAIGSDAAGASIAALIAA